jgi:hypothetical protein
VRQVCQEEQALCIRVSQLVNTAHSCDRWCERASEQTRTIAYALTMVHKQVHQTRHAHLSAENVLLK